MLVRLKLAETMREAVSLIEQGHVRVGPDTVRQSASAARATGWASTTITLDEGCCRRVCRRGHARLTWQVSDPAYLVTRQMEDYVTWVDTSKVKRTVMKYNDKLDDFDLL